MLPTLFEGFSHKGKRYLLPEPELDVSQATIFDRLLEDLQGAMELVKEDILSKFDALTLQVQEYQKLMTERKKLHPGQTRKYERALAFQ